MPRATSSSMRKCTSTGVPGRQAPREGCVRRKGVAGRPPPAVLRSPGDPDEAADEADLDGQLTGIDASKEAMLGNGLNVSYLRTSCQASLWLSRSSSVMPMYAHTLSITWALKELPATLVLNSLVHRAWPGHVQSICQPTTPSSRSRGVSQQLPNGVLPCKFRWRGALGTGLGWGFGAALVAAADFGFALAFGATPSLLLTLLLLLVLLLESATA